MGEREDYAEGDTRRRRGSPLLTLALVAAIVAAVFLAGYLALIAIAYFVFGIPE